MKRYCREKLNDVRILLRQVLGYMGRRHVATIASSSAFWIFLSLVPMVILIVSLLPYTGIRETELLDALAGFVPESFRVLLAGIVAEVYQSSAALLSLSLVTTLYSSGMGFSALIRGLEEIYEQPERTGFFRRRAKATFYMLVFLTAMLLSLLLMGFGRTVQNFLEAHFPFVHGFFAFLPKLRFGVVQAVLVLIFASVYRWAPGLELRFVRQLPGAVFSALGWTLFSAGFSFWITLTNGYSTYGSLATVAVAMVWLYYCITILLWGGCINKALEPLWDD